MNSDVTSILSSLGDAWKRGDNIFLLFPLNLQTTYRYNNNKNTNFCLNFIADLEMSH